MTTTGPVLNVSSMSMVAGPVAAAPSGCETGLPTPLLCGGEPTDVLGMMMAAVERMSLISGDEAEKRIQDNHAKLDKAMDDFMDKISQALEAARKAAKAKKKKGLFGKIAGAVGGIAAKIVGATVDFVKDTIKAPFEMGYSFAKNGATLDAFKASLEHQFNELTTNGDWANSVEKFTAGVVQFAADYADFAVACSTVAARAVATGESPIELLKEEAIQLWESLSDNILANEGFWDVIEPLAKATAVAAAIGTGGALGFVAVGVMMMLEIDSKTSFLDKAIGEDVAPYVRVGMGVGVSASVAFGGGEVSNLVKYLGGTKEVLGGLAQVDQARINLKEAKLAKEDALRDADMQQTLHRVRTLHQLADDLVEAFEEISQGRQTNHALFQSLAQGQNAAEAATVFRA